MWFCRKKRVRDVLVEYGSIWDEVEIERDAIGRPFVRVCGEPIVLARDGNTDPPSYRRWIPLSDAAASIWRGEA